MRILLDTGDYRCRNFGDVAMLQVAVRRLRELVPGASIEVLTEDEGALAVHCPGTIPVPCRGRRLWFSERTLLGRLHDVLPEGVSRTLIGLEADARSRHPGLVHRSLRWRLRRSPAEASALDAFFDAATGADAVVVTGAGGITDHARSWVLPVLQLLRIAESRGVPAAMFGHGLGPLTDPELLTGAREVLPGLALVALREGRTGPALARTLGVPPARIVVTGDDAVEPAWDLRPARLGSGLGVNVRVSRSSGVGPEALARLRPALEASARSLGTEPVPVPISFNERAAAPSTPGAATVETLPDLTDSQSLRELLAGFDGYRDAGESLRNVRDVIKQVGRCRVVLTGAYHAAVFALSQGISAVCLAGSDYFETKMLGLADQFGEGCTVVSLRDREIEAAVSGAVRHAWEDADRVRPALLEAARRQVEQGRAACSAFVEDVVGRGAGVRVAVAGAGAGR